jgi:ADP-heptose:LPS heptosyltransferase
MNLGILKTNHLGDNLVFLPVVQALRRRFPTWRITLLTAPRVVPLYAADIAPEDLLTCEPDELKRAWRRPEKFLHWWRVLRGRKLDATLVGYDQSSSAHALAWLAGGRLRVGGAGLRIRLRGLLTHGVACRQGFSIAQWNWEIARTLLAALGEHDWPAAPPPPDLSHLVRGQPRVPRRVVIHAGSKSPFTRWPLERYAELAGRLSSDHEVLWINAPELRRIPLPAAVTAVECGDLTALVPLIASAALFVGNNSGPMHVADALGTPLVAITGPTEFVWDAKFHPARNTVLRLPDLRCQPCDWLQYPADCCRNATEPLACLQRWSVSALEHICLERLAGGGETTRGVRS